MSDRVSAEATTEFRAKMGELLVAVDERLELDLRFECAGPECGSMELARHYSHWFGRVLLACYEFDLVEEIGGQLRWLAGVMGRRGFGPGYFGRLLEAWSVAIMSSFRLAYARELTAPLDSLRGNLGLLLEGRQPEPGLSVEARELLDRLRARKRREAAESVLALAKSGLPLERVLEDVVLSAMKYLGFLWETGRITVADEHAATEICRYVLYRLFDSVEPGKSVGLKALTACVPGDEHELGVMIVGEYLRLKGWQTFVVGRSSPQEDILKALADFRPDVVFFSATLVANLPAVRSLVAEVQKTLPGIGVVLGGPAAVAAADVLSRPGLAVATHFAEAASLGVKLATRNA